MTLFLILLAFYLYVMGAVVCLLLIDLAGYNPWRVRPCVVVATWPVSFSLALFLVNFFKWVAARLVNEESGTS